MAKAERSGWRKANIEEAISGGNKYQAAAKCSKLQYRRKSINESGEMRRRSAINAAHLSAAAIKRLMPYGVIGGGIARRIGEAEISAVAKNRLSGNASAMAACGISAAASTIK